MRAGPCAHASGRPCRGLATTGAVPADLSSLGSRRPRSRGCSRTTSRCPTLMTRALGLDGRAGGRWQSSLGAGLAPHLDLGLPPRGLRSRQRGPHPGPNNVGSSRSRDLQAGAGGRVAREGPDHDPRTRPQTGHSCTCRQDRRTLYHRAPTRSERSPPRRPPPRALPGRRPATCGTSGIPKAASRMRKLSRRRAMASTTGATCSTASAPWKRDTPRRRDTSTTSQRPRLVCAGDHRGGRAARGVRALNQRCDGEDQVSVSKVVAAEPET